MVEAEEGAGSFGFKCIKASDDYTGALLRDGTLHVFGKNDRGQMGVGSGIGIDMIESENTPKEVDFQQSLAAEEQSEPVIVTDLNAGQNTMLVRDSKNRVYKTGMKIDYTPKLCRFSPELLEADKIRELACGRAHYVILDADNQLHISGKVLKSKAESTHEGFEVHDADELFDGGRVTQLSMDYEIFGALVEDK